MILVVFGGKYSLLIVLANILGHSITQNRLTESWHPCAMVTVCTRGAGTACIVKQQFYFNEIGKILHYLFYHVHNQVITYRVCCLQSYTILSHVKQLVLLT